MKRVTVIGSYLSPYVRKVLAALHRKGIAYEIDPITPFMGDDRFSQLSPLRRIPVLLDGDVALADPSVICEYLEEKRPEPALYPREIAARARARWFEEYADSRMGDVFIWRYWYPRVDLLCSALTRGCAWFPSIRVRVDGNQARVPYC